MDSATQRLLSKVNTNLDDEDSLRVILVGSAERIIATIRELDELGFAAIGEWSPLLQMLNSRELISILRRTEGT